MGWMRGLHANFQLRAVVGGVTTVPNALRADRAGSVLGERLSVNQRAGFTYDIRSTVLSRWSR